jgi:putative ABC transport system substrate-binding protein
MRRREFLMGLCNMTAALPLLTGTMPALAQTANRVYRLGHLANSEASVAFTRQISLPELAKLGFVEGRNLVFESRVGGPDAMPGLMGELLAVRPDAIIAIGPTAVAAAAATRTVPIVAFGADMVALGLAASYARPGENVTGVAILANELEVKRLSILHEAVPDRRRVAVLTSTVTAVTAVGEAAMQKAASGFGIELLPFSVKGPADYPSAFAAMQAAGAQALVISATSEFYRDARQLAALALAARLPTICEWADMARSGCLIGYGPNREALRKRIAAQVAQIFGGATVGNIAIELPTVFEFAVNQKTAKSLELSVPGVVLTQADEIIE